jgi:DNA polymerase III epsilon subunit-like protein
MKIFVFDTETTWFIDKKEKDLDMQPNIIQFAWIMWNIKNWEFEEEKRVNILINPKKPIPYDSSQIHHIYDIDVKDAPYIEEVINEIIESINTPDIIVWHNIEYDIDMLKLELRRLWKEFEYKPKQIKCTMNDSINFCQLAKKNENSSWYKRPKLWELHKKLFWEYFIWAHDAMTDVEATLKSFLELVNNWTIKINTKKEEIMSLF